MLKEEEHTQVEIPSCEQFNACQEKIVANFPDLNRVWCVMHGLEIPIQKLADEAMQNAYYNGWLHDHFVACFFAFAPSGIVVACMLNAPGSWHNSFIAENGGLHAKMESVYNATGGKAVGGLSFFNEAVSFSYRIW